MNKTTEPATQPAAPTTAAAIGGYIGAPAVVAAPAVQNIISGTGKLRDQIDDALRDFSADDRWFYVSADPVGCPVTHWMEFPEPPGNVEFSGTPAALSPEAPLERRVGPQCQ